jgi:membrane peptidoglycan carboxypeptidase
MAIQAALREYSGVWFGWSGESTPQHTGQLSTHKLNGVTIGGRYYGAVFGNSVPGPIWKDTMTVALRGVPPTPFHPIDTGRFGGCEVSCRAKPADRTTGPGEESAAPGRSTGEEAAGAAP